MAREDKMIEATKAESEKKIQYVKEIVDEMVNSDVAVTPYSVWKRSGLSKGFIYTNEEVKEYISQHRSDKPYNMRKYSQEDVFEQKIHDLEMEIARLNRELFEARKGTIEILTAENKQLKERLAKYEELERKGLISVHNK